MFLDDELLKMCENAEVGTPEGVQKLNKDICKKCDKYYKNKLHNTSTKKEIKAVLDRIFNLFDSFVRRALASEDKKIQILGGMFEKYTFKLQFLTNKEMNKIYNKLN